jgi:hypothetical protein
MADEPVLGLNMAAGKNGLVQTMVPGMILTIDKASFGKGGNSVFRRLYAPASAHTTQKESRSCKSCHNNPLAIGYGRGILNLSVKGRWTFEPRFALNPNDGLPEDAWTGFLRERNGITATREKIRPFNIAEQKKILTAGACLTCHEESSEVMRRGLVDFRKEISRRSSRCLLPRW